MQTNANAEKTGVPDTSEHTRNLDGMKNCHREAVERVRADGDLTPEDKGRRLAELERAHGERFAEESARVVGKLDAEIEAAYKAANGAPNGRGAHRGGLHAQEETARELRLARIREVVRDDLEGGVDALMAYKEAVRLGDRERSSMIARMGPRYLKGDTVRSRRLAELVEENLPQGRRKAREKLQRLETEKRPSRTRPRHAAGRSVRQAPGRRDLTPPVPCPRPVYLLSPREDAPGRARRVRVGV